MHIICSIPIMFRQLSRLGSYRSVAAVLFMIFFFAYTNIGFSQTNRIDSLKLVALNSSEIEKANVTLSIAKEFRVSNYDSVVHYGKMALNQATLINNTDLIIESLLELAYINHSLGNLERSIDYYNRAKRISIDEDNQYYLARIYIDLGRYYTKLSNYAGVISSLDTALKIIKTNNLANLESVAYYNIGTLYFDISDYSIAEYYANLAHDASMNNEDKTNYINSIFLLGNIFLKQNNFDTALNYFDEALNIASKVNDKVLIQQAYRRIANYYLEKKDYNKTIQYIDSSLIYCKELNRTNEIAALITYKAHIATLNSDYNTALKYNLKALELRKTTGHRLSVCSSLINIGSNYVELGDFEKAELYLDKGIKIAKDQMIIHYLNYGYTKLSALYKAEGNYKKALKYAELKAQYKDSILINRTNEKVVFFKSQYEFEKEKTKSEKLKLKKKANEEIFLIIVLILSGGVILLLIRIVYLRKKSTKEIVKLSQVIETTTQAVVITNTDVEVLYVNNGLIKMMGFTSKDDLIGRSTFDFTNTEGKELLKTDIYKSLLAEGQWKGEMTIIRKDGTSIICEEVCSVINDRDGNPEFFVAIFSDISMRKEGEVALQSIRINLEKTVKTQDKMLSIIAHDLTGPFSSILGLSELMAKEYDSYQRDDHIKFSQLIYSTSKHTFDLLTNLLQWSRTQMGNIDLNFEMINIHDLVNKNADLAKLLLIKKEVTFKNEVRSDMLAYADLNTVSVVIRNIVSNAIKFTQRGGLIIVTAVNDNSKIEITISDTGIGIEEEDIEGLFEIGNNKSHRGTEDEKGTGLGLVLCKEFTELNSGKISAVSTYGEGSKFTICLPTKKT